VSAAGAERERREPRLAAPTPLFVQVASHEFPGQHNLDSLEPGSPQKSAVARHDAPGSGRRRASQKHEVVRVVAGRPRNPGRLYDPTLASHLINRAPREHFDALLFVDTITPVHAIE